MSRPSAEMMPAVTVPPSPNGLPTATTQSPTLAWSLSPQRDKGQLVVGVDLQQREVGLFVAADDLRRMAAVVLQDHGDLIGVADDVVVGHDVAARIDDEARAERHDLAPGLRLAAVLEEPAQQLVERRAGCRSLRRRRADGRRSRPRRSSGRRCRRPPARPDRPAGRGSAADRNLVLHLCGDVLSVRVLSVWFAAGWFAAGWFAAGWFAAGGSRPAPRLCRRCRAAMRWRWPQRGTERASRAPDG